MALTAGSARRRRRQQELHAWRHGAPAGESYTGEPADLPTLGVLGGGQLGKMLATAAVSCRFFFAAACAETPRTTGHPQPGALLAGCELALV